MATLTPEIYKSLQSKVPNHDLLHGAIVAVLPHVEQIRNVRSYIARVAWRKRINKTRGAEDKAVEHPPIHKESQVEQLESMSIIRNAVKDLPPRECFVVSQRYFGDKDCGQIASELGTTPSAIRGLLHRAHRRLAPSLCHLADL
jgi:RNA polymerase sigma factor (sigma-70 family)